ncbi:MAG: hypothetical protein ACXU8A_13300 [Burkholderiaceae bacterium]
MTAIPDVALEAKVAFLRQPTSFPESTYRVEAIETHMSWVFLTDGYAYKLKKPVRHDFLDFSTIEARRFYCEEEVRLNRRLATDVYLGIVAINLDSRGHLQLGTAGNAIDWLVKMRRLPIKRMLDYAIKHGTATEQDIVKVATRLAHFYQTCTPVILDANEYRNRFLHHINCTRQELIQSVYQLSVTQINGICTAQSAALLNMAALFDERIQSEKIVEGHGDLRPEHVCLNPELDIIDCLEFSYDLRIADPVDELGFLALECERLGATDFGALLLRTYSELSGDMPAAALVHFYQSYRASLRAAIAIRHLNEEKFRYSPEWPRRAREYLKLAELHIAHCS